MAGARIRLVRLCYNGLNVAVVTPRLNSLVRCLAVRQFPSLFESWLASLAAAVAVTYAALMYASKTLSCQRGETLESAPTLTATIANATAIVATSQPPVSQPPAVVMAYLKWRSKSPTACCLH